MAEGVKFGRKRKLSDYQRAEAIKRHRWPAWCVSHYSGKRGAKT
jgi:hypothetical protein